MDQNADEAPKTEVDPSKLCKIKGCSEFWVVQCKYIWFSRNLGCNKGICKGCVSKCCFFPCRFVKKDGEYRGEAYAETKVEYVKPVVCVDCSTKIMIIQLTPIFILLLFALIALWVPTQTGQ